MIERINASEGSFKPVEFEAGFNVVLAERSEGSGERDSRNGSGKSSLIEIVHFLLGADLGRSSISSSALEGWRFSIDFSSEAGRFKATRSTGEPSKIWIDGAKDSWPVRSRIDPDSDRPYLGLDPWKELLGWLIFGIAPEIASETYAPTLRSLLPYFARRGRDAFSDPFVHFRNQPSWNRQLSTAFLLDLDWQYVRSGELLRQRDEKLREARKAIEAWRRSADAAAGSDRQTGDLEGQLEAMKINLERRIRESETQLGSFQVHPQYEQLEAKASSLTKAIHDLSNENVVDRELLEFNRAALEEERPADPDAIEAMYAEAEIYFPERVTRRLRDVQEFHQAIFLNRRNFLGGELGRLEGVIANRESQIETLSEERAGFLSVLQEHGALSEFLKLQERHSQTLEQLGHVNAQLEQLRGFDAELAEIRLQRDQNAIDARTDFQNRRDRWSKAVDIFGANTAELYEEPGELALGVTDNGGLSMRFDIQAGESQGVQEMMVFCYDLMLAELWSERGSGPGFLIHDSTIFDGVDERQVAKGLALAERKSRECGFQYVCCLNSDAVPWRELEGTLDLRDHVRLELSDKGDDGGLFGIRF